jgi:hypothetical protein
MFASSSHHCIYKFQLLSKIEQIFDSWKEHYQAVIFPTFVLQAVVFPFFCFFKQSFFTSYRFSDSRFQTVAVHKQSFFTSNRFLQKVVYYSYLETSQRSSALAAGLL